MYILPAVHTVLLLRRLLDPFSWRRTPEPPEVPPLLLARILRGRRPFANISQSCCCCIPHLSLGRGSCRRDLCCSKPRCQRAPSCPGVHRDDRWIDKRARSLHGSLQPEIPASPEKCNTIKTRKSNGSLQRQGHPVHDQRQPLLPLPVQMPRINSQYKPLNFILRLPLPSFPTGVGLGLTTIAPPGAPAASVASAVHWLSARCRCGDYCSLLAMQQRSHKNQHQRDGTAASVQGP